MGRKPCIALLLCLCSCSLDTTPDIGPANEADASMSRTSPRKGQQASLRFDAPLQPRTTTALKRAALDDADAGSGPKRDAKPESRDAGRTASDRPAQTPPRDAGAMDASAKQKSKSTSQATGDVKDASAGHSQGGSQAKADPAASQTRDAGASRSTHSSEERSESDSGHHNGSERRERSDDNDDEHGSDDRDWNDRGSDDGDSRRHGSSDHDGHRHGR